MKVSIVIPVYNVEQFLERCVQSAISQTYNNLEIILVDDGSTDQSGQMCDKFAQKDNRIRVIHKKNGGLSSARNTGVRAATGDYIFLLDSDDYISKICIKKCVWLISKYNADIAIVQMANVSESMNDEVKSSAKVCIELFDTENAIQESLYQKKFSCSSPGKLYKKKILKEVQFPEGRLSEDLATCHLFFEKANKIVYTSQYAYFYRQREHSIMHTFNPKRLDAIKWAREIEGYCKKYYPDIYGAAICRSFNVAIHILLDLPAKGELHDRYITKIWRNITRTRKTVIVDNNVRKREKAAAFLSFFGEKTLRLIWNSKLSVKRRNL